MYITEQQTKLIADYFEKVTTEYIEKLDFLNRLIIDDDWSFVIKSHALIESLVTELIITKISQDNLKPIIERIPLHGDIVSKIVILNKYNLLNAEDISFIKNFSEIRNSIVHKYENINFSFDNYLLTLDNNKKKNWRKLLQLEDIDRSKIDKLIDKKPKAVFWLRLLHIANFILAETSQLKITKKGEDQANKTSREILELLSNNL